MTEQPQPEPKKEANPVGRPSSSDAKRYAYERNELRQISADLRRAGLM